MEKRIKLALSLALVAPAWLVTAHAAEEQTQTAPQTQMQQGSKSESETQATASSQLMQHKAGDLAGMTVQNPNGEKIGKVDMVAQNKQDRKLYAVVSSGGFFGIGEKKVTVPLDKLQLQEGKLVATAPMEMKTLEQQSAYNKEDYQPIQKDTVLASVSGAQPAQQQQARASFDQLDTNKDGYISQSEAKNDQQLAQNWKSADTNSDGEISRSEFSAFEMKQGGQQPGQTQEQPSQQPGSSGSNGGAMESPEGQSGNGGY